MLLEYYSCKTLYENNYKDYSTYLSHKRKTHLLLRQPDNIIKDTVKNSTVARSYGIHMVEAIKNRATILLKDWLESKDERGVKNLYKIKDVNLLRELISYNSSGNFDRVIAMMLVCLYKEHNKMAVIQEQKLSSLNDTWINFHKKFVY
jgi:hypothetical protein